VRSLGRSGLGLGLPQCVPRLRVYNRTLQVVWGCVRPPRNRCHVIYEPVAELAGVPIASWGVRYVQGTSVRRERRALETEEKKGFNSPVGYREEWIFMASRSYGRT